ncbi:MAG TPA: MBG domain-containing protein, partial [Smithellaceae bacterium]|nr:MBG domain-containing protein [Smithellaceae bacterium]
MMNVKKYLTIVVLFLTGFLCSFAHAQQTSMDANLLVEGRATILKHDVARARESAVKNAQEKAVLQIAEKILSDKFSDEKFQAVKSILIGKAGQYVKNYAAGNYAVVATINDVNYTGSATGTLTIAKATPTIT